MFAQNELFELLQQIDDEFLGVVLLISTIGVFITIITAIVTVFRTINNITVTRMQQSMVKNLLAQGYSVDDVERLAYGTHRWGPKIRHIVQSAKSRLARMRPSQAPGRPPMPPVKQQSV